MKILAYAIASIPAHSVVKALPVRIQKLDMDPTFRLRHDFKSLATH